MSENGMAVNLGVSIADTKKEATMKKNCRTYGVAYLDPEESSLDNESRWKAMQKAIRREQDKQRRSKESVEQTKARKESDRMQTKKTRDNESQDQKDSRLLKNRVRNQEAIANETPEGTKDRLSKKANSQKRARANKKQRSPHSRPMSAPSRLSKTDKVEEASRDGPILALDKVEIDKLVKAAIAQAARTQRRDGKHRATVCVVCDRVIIGTEKVHWMTKDRILLNKERLSVKTYVEFYGAKLHPLLVKQYQVEGCPGLLLSPRSYRIENNFETCSSCFSSLRPCMAKGNKKPPKHAIANGFAIGHIPETLQIDGVNAPSDMSNGNISDVMCAAVARQRPYGFIFAFVGGAHQSVMGQFLFFDMNQSHVGGVINHYRSTGANDHILCALCGRFTPGQRVTAMKQAQLDTRQYVDLMTWFIKESNHYGYRDVIPPEDCPQPRILTDKENDSNTDVAQNPSVEDEFGGGTFTFTSAHDPSESNGVYKNSTEFTMAILNQASPLMLAYGGNYVNARELRLECIFPVQFPFGIGGPKMNRPTQISEEACLQHYLHLSLPQFMRGDFLLVVLHMYNRIMSFQSGLITSRLPGRNGQ